MFIKKSPALCLNKILEARLSYFGVVLHKSSTKLDYFAGILGSFPIRKNFKKSASSDGFGRIRAKVSGPRLRKNSLGGKGLARCLL